MDWRPKVDIPQPLRLAHEPNKASYYFSKVLTLNWQRWARRYQVTCPDIYAHELPVAHYKPQKRNEESSQIVDNKKNKNLLRMDTGVDEKKNREDLLRQD